jgi:hypothetical protein
MVLPVNGIVYIQMLIKEVEPLTPAQKAERLGLQPSYFSAPQMNIQALQAVEFVKRKDRPRLNVLTITRSLPIGIKKIIFEVMRCINCSIVQTLLVGEMLILFLLRNSRGSLSIRITQQSFEVIFIPIRLCLKMACTKELET